MQKQTACCNDLIDSRGCILILPKFNEDRLGVAFLIDYLMVKPFRLLRAFVPLWRFKHWSSILSVAVYTVLIICLLNCTDKPTNQSDQGPSPQKSPEEELATF